MRSRSGHRWSFVVILTQATEPRLFIGMMSGTSVDGIDVAIVRCDDDGIELCLFAEQTMPEKVRQAIFRLMEPGFGEIDNLGALDYALGELYAEAALAAIRAAGLSPNDITAIGNHGQTIRHRPDFRYPFSLQIGSAAVIAERTGITTVSDFRSRDIACGGQGAPLVPFAHAQLFSAADANTAILNLGGIANITWLGRDGTITGFDCGPGNLLMDGLMQRIDGSRYDRDGTLAAAGQVCEPLLAALMRHPFLRQEPPKSAGRETFGAAELKQVEDWPELSDADRMATLTMLTVEAVATSCRFLPATPDRWLICGGGARNHHLMQQLQKRLTPASVESTQAAGIDPQAVEAVSFALLARATLDGVANTIPSVTGAKRPVCGGQITPKQRQVLTHRSKTSQ